MSERKINLEEILDGVKLEKGATFSSYISKDGDIYRIVKIAMKEACRQILELATENAEVEEIEIAESIHGGEGYTYYRVDKQSILNIINQIE